MGGCQVMHTKLSVHHFWCTLDLVCITWGPHEDRIKQTGPGTIIEIIEIIEMIDICFNTR